MYQFSLFDEDPLNRLFNAIGIKSRGVISGAARVALFLLVTWAPTAFFALNAGFTFAMPRELNFFGDLGAIGQAFIGIPLFVIAEVVIGAKTRSAAAHFFNSGVLQDGDRPALNRLHAQVAALRRRIMPDLICLAIGYVCAVFWMYEEMHNQRETWHALGPAGGQIPTAAGLWVCFVGIPIFNYWWLRWVWKIAIWTWYLYRVSRFRLRLIASHPDMTGGLTFLSEAQTSFAVVIFAFGLGIIAPLVGYKLEVENAELFSFAVGGPLLSFIVGAPLFFTAPLLMFTKQLQRTKKRAINHYQARATEAAIYFEQRWLTPCHGENCEVLMGNYLGAMRNLTAAYDQMKRMRVVPFDPRSFTELFGSTAGSLLPLIPKVFELPEPAKAALELLKKLAAG